MIMLSKFRNVFNKRVYDFQKYRSYRLTNNDLSKVESTPLTASEKQQIDNIYSSLYSDIWNKKDDGRYIGHQLYKALNGFNPLFVPETFMYPLILAAINNRCLIQSFQHKALYDFYYHEIDRPLTLGKCINGVIYNSSNNVLSKQELLRELSKYEKFIVKPSCDSERGMNVRIYTSDSINKDFYNNELKRYNGNFIIQTLVNQSVQTSKFNNGSLNTFRINTLSLNGEVSLSTIGFRCGKGNSIVDNVGAGGLMVGVNSNGEFKKYAYDAQFRKYTMNNEVQFEKTVIPQVSKMCAIALNAHKQYLPFLGIVAWDFCLDVNEKPIMIEVNLDWLGTEMEQICSQEGIFGTRTKEFIDYAVKAHPVYLIDYNIR